MLNAVLPGLLPQPVSGLIQSNFYVFKQRGYLPVDILTAAEISMSEAGYVYIPSPCRGGSTKCLLHVCFHGCLQGLDSIGDRFVQVWLFPAFIGIYQHILLRFKHIVLFCVIPDQLFCSYVLLTIILKHMRAHELTQFSGLAEWAEANNIVVLFPQVLLYVFCVCFLLLTV